MSKTNSVILLSLFCCLSMLCRLVFIFSMAQRNSAAQCQAGRNSTNSGKSEKIACIFSVLVALHCSGRWCPRWCYPLGLAVAGSAGVCCAACVPLVVLVLLCTGGERANEPQDLARVVFCTGFVEKIGQKSFLGRKVGRRRNIAPTAAQTAHRTPGTPPGYTNTPHAQKRRTTPHRTPHSVHPNHSTNTTGQKKTPAGVIPPGRCACVISIRSQCIEYHQRVLQPLLMR